MKNKQWTITIPIAGMSVVALIATGLFLLQQSTDTPVASAQEVVDRACANMEQLDSYDITGTITATDPGGSPQAISITARVSGDDYHVTYSPEGSDSTLEGKRVAGVSYYRDSSGGNEWYVLDGNLEDLTASFDGLGGNPVCPDTTGMQARGAASVDGTTTRHFVATASPASSGQGTSGDTSYQFWVNNNGQLVKHQQDTNSTAQTDTGGPGVRLQMVTTFSGIGEANTITAPVVSGQ